MAEGGSFTCMIRVVEGGGHGKALGVGEIIAGREARLLCYSWIST